LKIENRVYFVFAFKSTIYILKSTIEWPGRTQERGVLRTARLAEAGGDTSPPNYEIIETNKTIKKILIFITFFIFSL
jgi:hypothetical protein